MRSWFESGSRNKSQMVSLLRALIDKLDWPLSRPEEALLLVMRALSGLNPAAVYLLLRIIMGK